MIQFRQVKKAYHQRTILHIPQLELHSGLYRIKGANGSGKTTLLKMVAGIIPFEGDILLQQVSMHRRPVQYRQQISWAEAEPQYPSFITGTQLLKLYLNIRRLPWSQAEPLLAAWDMQTWIDMPTGTYSAGMTKKLSLVLALCSNTPVMVLDEPLITLDAAAVQVLCEHVLQMQQQGTLFLMSSHQQLDARVELPVMEYEVKNGQLSAL